MFVAIKVNLFAEAAHNCQEKQYESDSRGFRFLRKVQSKMAYPSSSVLFDGEPG